MKQKIPLLLALSSIIPISCHEGPKVTIYCALDKIYSEPILREFERETGIQVNAIFDIEASKTVGLVRTLIEEKNRPQCDVFWNNELAQTIKLKNLDVLQPYDSPQAKEIPSEYRDPENYWTGFAARARIFIINKELLPESEWPRSLSDLTEVKYKGRGAMAKPLTGTTITHVAALFFYWKEERTKRFCEALYTNEVHFALGNAHVSKLVAKGNVAFGLTDTDDFNARLSEGAPVAAVYPDPSGDGTLLIPNSVAMIAGAPHPQEAKKLIDWILRPQTEAQLAQGQSSQIPLRPAVSHPDRVKVPGDFSVMQVHWPSVAVELEKRAPYLRETFEK